MARRFGRTTVVATLAVSALALGACSGGSSSAGSSSTSGSSSSASGTTSSAAGSSGGTAADAALAQAELLPASAYPSGWKSQGASSGNSSASVLGGLTASEQQAVTQCLGISSSGIVTPAEATSPEYDDPNSSATVTDTVDVFPTAAAAQFDEAAGANPKMPACFEQLATRFENAAPKGMQFGTVTATRATIPHLGDRDTAVTVTVPFTYQGVSGALHMEMVVVVKGRSEANLQFTNTTAVDQTLVDSLSTAAAAALHAG